VDGALDLFAQAFQQVPETESEDRAWILTHMAHLQAGLGRRDLALTLLEEALVQFPDYHYALAQLGQVRADQGRFDDSLDALRRRYTAAAHPENLYDLAVALARAGREAEAREAFARFEKDARAEMDGPDNANRELVFYYADHASRPEEALRLSEREVGRRRDVRTLEAHAWALFRNGRAQEARGPVEEALAVGVKDAALLYRAGVILRAAGDSARAKRYLEESLRVDSGSEKAGEAKALLAAFTG
jgi:tetratricopeptide (TPR) repeat protein